MASFRSSEYCERYEVEYNLETPIEPTANGALQKKSGYIFTVDTSNVRHPMDWYNAHFELDFKITKMDNTNYGANDAVATINGGFSFIRSLIVNFGGETVINTNEINHAINVKNLTDFSTTYNDNDNDNDITFLIPEPVKQFFKITLHLR